MQGILLSILNLLKGVASGIISPFRSIYTALTRHDVYFKIIHSDNSTPTTPLIVDAGANGRYIVDSNGNFNGNSNWHNTCISIFDANQQFIRTEQINLTGYKNIYVIYIAKTKTSACSQYPRIASK